MTGHIKHMGNANIRERLLDAGLETLHRRGFNGCGVQEITEHAGVPKGSFYNHFASKEALGAAVLERYWEQRAESVLRLLEETNVGPRERLRRYFSILAANMAKRSYRSGCLIGNLGAELSDQSELVRDSLVTVFAGWTKAIEACIREAQRMGEVRVDCDAAVLASFLIDAWEGAVLRAKVVKSEAPFKEFNEVVFEMLLAPALKPSEESHDTLQ
jgi:TetR/AcrR family transcriptional regulator, transcriptional repressor for nem operon